MILFWLDEKGIRNENIVVYKLGLALIKATTHRLEVVRKERHKREEIIESRKIEAIAAKHQRTRREISLPSKK